MDGDLARSSSSLPTAPSVSFSWHGSRPQWNQGWCRGCAWRRVRGVNKSTPLGNRLQVEKTKSERASNRVTIACKLGHRCSHFTDRAPVLGPPWGPRRPPRLLRSRCPIARTRGVGQEVQGRRTRKCRWRVAPGPGSRRLSELCQRRGAVAARGTTAGLSAANDGCMLCQKASRPEHEALDQGQALVPVAG